jgi:uncharacterized protein YciI
MFSLGLRRNVPPRSEWTASLEEHLAWMKRQHAAGTILVAGPTTGCGSFGFAQDDM